MLNEKYIHQELKAIPELMALYKRFSKKAKNIYYGRNRIVFDMGMFVAKLPCAWGGFGDNDWEGSVSNSKEQMLEPTKHLQYARTKLVYVGGIPVCYMEKVDEALDIDGIHPFDNKRMPGWVSYVDCGQVGYTRRGRLVAYDWGRN